MPRRGSTDRRKRQNFTKAGDITVTSADGSVRVLAAYNLAQADKVVETGKANPQTHDEGPTATVDRLNRGVKRR